MSSTSSFSRIISGADAEKKRQEGTGAKGYHDRYPLSARLDSLSREDHTCLTSTEVGEGRMSGA